jgi:hypothetical protein
MRPDNRYSREKTLGELMRAKLVLMAVCRCPFLRCRVCLYRSANLGLKLDADWVILSACNTAAGAGDGEAAEALSGLARVFFYAGARALLVSHWEVDSDAAVKPVTHAVRALANQKKSWPRRGASPRHARSDARHVAAGQLDARVAPLRVGTVRGGRRGRRGAVADRGCRRLVWVSERTRSRERGAARKRVLVVREEFQLR